MYYNIALTVYWESVKMSVRENKREKEGSVGIIH